MKINMTDSFRNMLRENPEEMKVFLEIILAVRAKRNIIVKRSHPVDISWVDDSNGMGPCKLSNSVRCF